MITKFELIGEAALSLDHCVPIEAIGSVLPSGWPTVAGRAPNDNEKTSMDGRACSSGSPSPTAGPSPGGGPSPSHGGGYSTFSGREELPDLTEHLKANGIYEDRVAAVGASA